MATGILVELRRKVSGAFNNDNTLLFVKSHWNNMVGIPSDVINISALLDGKVTKSGSQMLLATNHYLEITYAGYPQVNVRHPAGGGVHEVFSTAHLPTWDEVTGKPSVGGWQLIRDTEFTVPDTITANNVSVVSGNYYNKILAFEVRVVTGTDTYETHIVFARMGSNTTTSASATYDRLYSWSTFDGQYFKTHSFKAYCSNSVSGNITIGFRKHLIGNFSGTTIAWTTNTTTAMYIEKIWLVN